MANPPDASVDSATALGTAIREIAAGIDSLRVAVTSVRVPDRVAVEVVAQPPRDPWEVTGPVVLGAVIALVSSLLVEQWREYRQNRMARKRVGMRLASDLITLRGIASYFREKPIDVPVVPGVFRDVERLGQEYQSGRSDLFAVRKRKLREALGRWYVLVVNRFDHARRREEEYASLDPMERLDKQGSISKWRRIRRIELWQLIADGERLLAWTRRESREPAPVSVAIAVQRIVKGEVPNESELAADELAIGCKPPPEEEQPTFGGVAP